MNAYYNEIDPYAAQWLRHLIAAGHLPAGGVDERSIIDVRPADLRGYTQCHFFAGIGGWPYALRLAGWPDGRPVWTGSCPCQPLSSAGQRKGHADERHLWPAFHALIAERRPAAVFGEQVASRDGREWLAGVRADLEASGYAVGAADLCAASQGAPHIRQRLFWVARGLADADGWEPCDGDVQRGWQQRQQPQNGGAGRGLGDTALDGQRQERQITGGRGERDRAQGSAERSRFGDGACSGLGDADTAGLSAPECEAMEREGRRQEGRATGEPSGSPWTDAIWLLCLDGKARRIEPGSFPLAHGVPARVGRLRAYGNAIVPQVAAEFVRAYFGDLYT